MNHLDSLLRHPGRILPGALLLLCLVAVCDVHISNISSNGSDADLTASTNVIYSGAVPEGLKTLEVDNYDGVIEVAGTNGGPYQWSQSLKVRAHTEADAQAMARALTCQAEQTGDQLKLLVTAPDAHTPVSFESDLVITVPARVSVQARNHFSTIEIADVAGPVTATDESGRMEIRRVAGEVHAQTCYATLHVEHTGPATLKNQSGTLEAADIHGALTAETSYATLEVKDVSGPVRLRDQSGRVSVQRTGPADVETSYATLEVKAINGDATLADQSGRVQASGVVGTVLAATSYATMEITGDGPGFFCTDQSGSVQIHATSAVLTNLEATTSYASMEVSLSGHLNQPAIRAHTSYAAVESDFPLLAETAGTDPFGSVPAGVSRINLENQSGKIRIIRR